MVAIPNLPIDPNAQALDALRTVARCLRVNAGAIQPARPALNVTLARTGAAGGLPSLQGLIDLLPPLPLVPKIKDYEVKIDLDALLKFVRFEKPELFDATTNPPTVEKKTVGGMPIHDLIPTTALSPPNNQTQVALPPGVASAVVVVPVDAVAGATAVDQAAATNGPALPPGVPGASGWGALRATIPVVMLESDERNVDLESLKVVGELRIEIFRNSADGVPVLVQDYSIEINRAAAGGELDRLVDRLALFTVPTVQLPVVIDDLGKSDAIALPTFIIKAAVRVSVPLLRLSTDWIELAPLTVPIPALPVPRAIVLFQHPYFSMPAKVLVVLPTASRIRTAPDLRAAMGTLRTLVEAAFPALPAAGLVAATVAIAQANFQAEIIVEIADRIDNLDEVVYREGFLTIGRFTAEDNMCSCLYVGPPETSAHFFNNRNTWPNEGHFALTIENFAVGGDLPDVGAVVDDLRSKAPISKPSSAITHFVKPDGFNFARARFITMFAQELSSLYFA